MTQHYVSSVLPPATLWGEMVHTQTLGEYVRERRERLGLTVTALAATAELSKSEISALENGRIGLPGADKRRRLARALNVPHLELLVIAGEITQEELGTTVGKVERDPDDPRTELIKIAENLEPVKIPMGLEILQALARSRAGWS